MEQFYGQARFGFEIVAETQALELQSDLLDQPLTFRIELLIDEVNIYLWTPFPRTFAKFIFVSVSIVQVNKPASIALFSFKLDRGDKAKSWQSKDVKTWPRSQANH
jgi:hypothetical protein